MQDKMNRFLSSLGLADPQRFDFSFTSIGKKKAGDHYQVAMVISKESPWDYASLQEFQEALANVRYDYSLSFTYEKAPSFDEVSSLYDDWFLSHYHAVSDFEISLGEGNKILAKMPRSASKRDSKAIIRDFGDLLKFLNYPFSIELANEEVAPIPASETKAEVKEEEKVDSSCAEEGTSDSLAPASEEVLDGPAPVEDEAPLSKEDMDAEAKRVSDAAVAEANYIESLKAARYSQKGNYREVATIKELYSIQSQNVTFIGTVFEATVKLSRKGKQIGSYDVSDLSSAISVKGFENKMGLSAADIIAIGVGDYVRVKGRVEADKFSGETIIIADFFEKLPPKPLRDDPEPEKRVELHLHTKMSSMDGVGEMSDYCKLAKNMGMKAIAVTDHGDIQSFPAAQNAAKKNGIHMIYGCEFYMFDPFLKYVFNPSPIELYKARYCVLDLETTGLSSMFDRITEFGGVIIEDGKVVDRLDLFVNPECKIPKLIVEKTHITDEMVKDADKIGVAMAKIEKFIGDTVLVTHNASFDMGFLNESRRRLGLIPFANPVVDTLALSHFLFPERRYHNLEALYKNLGLGEYKEDAAHRADADAESTSIAWKAILPRLASLGKKTHADLASLSFDEATFPELSSDELDAKRNAFYKNLRSNHIIALVKNAAGLKDMYKLISLSNTQFLLDVPKIPKSELARYHENLLFGSACFNGEVFDSATYKGLGDLKELMSFYDYIEIQPVENYSYLVNMEETTNDRLMDVLKLIIRAADESGKPIVATGDVHYVNPEDKICRDVYIFGKLMGGGRHPMNPPRRASKPDFPNPDQHFRSTREMMDSFKKWLPEDKCREIIIKNTNDIAKEIEDVYPVKPDIFPPNANLPDSAKMLKDICYKNLYATYGDNPDPLIKKRLDKELDGIIGHGYSVTYYIAHCIIKKASEDGYFVGSRGSVGSSFAATMADITEVNPLPPHYLCPKCKHFEWNRDPKILSGFDLPDKKCPVCGEAMLKNGQNIPFETFLGFNAEKVPDIDLNFPPDYQARAHDYTRQLLGEKNCFRAGTIETVAEKIAFGMVRGYYEHQHIDPDTIPTALVAKIANGCQGVKRTTGQHPGGIVVIPKDMDVFDFTPYQHPADDLSSDWLTTHYEFASMHDEVLKLDLLGQVTPLALRKMSLITGVDFHSIPMDDKAVLSLFSSSKALNMKDNPLKFETGALGLPEFGTTFVQGLLSEAHAKSFNDLLIISGLSHGTNVWNNNAEDIVVSKTATLGQVIGCRDDIMNYLISMGVPDSTAFKIMEEVRHNKSGKPLKPETIEAMKQAHVPDWYIESCKKIQYLFPRAHATAYVMDSFRTGWYKIYKPLYFYAVFFSVRSTKWDIATMIQGEKAVLAKISDLQAKSNNKKEFTPKDAEILKTLIVASEMLERGFHFEKIDIYKSDASDFVVDEPNKALIPPFTVIDGLGEAAAETVVEARKNGKFISKEDLSDRTKLSETNISNLTALGSLDGMGENNQMSLFEF